jgi:hypothetical protein
MLLHIDAVAQRLCSNSQGSWDQLCAAATATASSRSAAAAAAAILSAAFVSVALLEELRAAVQLTPTLWQCSNHPCELPLL